MRPPSPFGPGNPEEPTLRYLFLRFLRYGWLAWGGPVAQIGMMHEELVERDAWITEHRFRRTLALYQALPGPEAHELAVFFGTIKRGRTGGFLTGLGFMLPGVVLVTIAAALYLRFAETATLAGALLYGVRPAVVALVAIALFRLLKVSVTSTEHVLVATGACAAGLLRPDVPFLLVLAAGGAVAWAASSFTERPLTAGMWPLLLGWPTLALGGPAALAIVCAKAGLLSFGGAYTAIPFLHRGAVVENGWMTESEFLDALALCSLVPGPLIAIGTFVGFVAYGLSGALIATVVIFAPAFAFTLVGHTWFERVVHEPRLHAFLVGVTAAVVGLVGVALVPLARTAFVDAPTVLVGLLSGTLFLGRRPATPWVIALAALLGGVFRFSA